MISLKKIQIGAVLLGAMIFVSSCKPKDNNNNNNNNPPPSPTAATVTITNQDKVSANPQDYVGLTVLSKAAAGTTLVSLTRHDGIGNDTVITDLTGKTLDTTLDLYYVPANAFAKTINITYTVVNSKGEKTTVSAKPIVIGAKQKVFAIYKKLVFLDQTDNALRCFLNTGGTATSTAPVVYSGADENGDTTKRRLIDLACIRTPKQTDVVCAPAYSGFDTIPQWGGLWTLSQMNKTELRKLPSSFNVTTCTAKSVQDAFTAAPAQPGQQKYRVQQVFGPTDIYAFKTIDGRYGAFLVTGFGGGVEITLAVESK